MLTDLFHPGIPLLEKVVRTVLVYAFLVVGLRLAGKRELSQLNPFDLVVLLLLSNTLQNAIIGEDNSLIGGVVGAATLLVLNSALLHLLYRIGRLDRVEGAPDALIVGGRLRRKRLERELITVAELEAAARRQGIASLKEVETCRLETGGALTFIPRRPTDDERRHTELLRALGEVADRQRELADRLATLERSS